MYASEAQALVFAGKKCENQWHNFLIRAYLFIHAVSLRMLYHKCPNLNILRNVHVRTSFFPSVSGITVIFYLVMKSPEF